MTLQQNLGLNVEWLSGQEARKIEPCTLTIRDRSCSL